MKTLLALGVCSLALSAAGCASADSDGAHEGLSEQHADLELLTWWSQPTELSAIDAVIAVHNVRHPNVKISVHSSMSSASVATDVESRLAEGTPPTAFQANLGGNAMQWADSAEALNDRARSWSSAFQPSILERLSSGSKLLGVPLALTRQNNAYYNVKLLKELDLPIPKGRKGFRAWLAALSEKGYTHPLCIGDLNNWVSAHVLFEDIVPAYLGADYAQAFWSGQKSADDPPFGEALDYAASLNPYWNTDFAEIDMAPGIERVMEERDPSEQCVMTPMGDWGGAILAADYAVDEAFSQRAWPGAEDLFVLAGDALVTAHGVKNQQQALDFFDTLASAQGQIAFNTKKGSVPARTMSEDERTEFGPLTQANMADLSAGTALPAYKVIGSSVFPWEELAKVTHDFLVLGDKQRVIDFIDKNYDKLSP
jgi:glucose/mannose transport system substrate-binding protein